jgi:dihydroflavonol-4-reductase
MPKHMRTLVTGATGFLGSWITRALSAAGHRPTVLVRDASRLDALSDLALDVVRGDLLEAESVRSAMSGVEAVIHVAGLVSLRTRDASELHRVNLLGTRNVLEAAAALGRRVLHTSSIGTLGLTQQPIAVNESQSPSGRIHLAYPYVESKRQSERLALEFARAGHDVCVLLPGNVFGPGDRNGTSTRLIKGYLEGRLRFYLRGGLSFADVRDVAAAYVTALEQAQAGQSYLLAGINLSYGQLLDQLWELTRLHRALPAPWPMAEMSAWWSEFASLFWAHPFEELNSSVIQYGNLFNYCDSSKAVRELGYRTRPFTDTLRDTIIDLCGQHAGLAGSLASSHFQALLQATHKVSPGRSPSAPDPR